MFTLAPNYDTRIDLPGAKLAKDDTRLLFQTYSLDPPMQPGESRVMHFKVKARNRGFENSVTNREIVQNGTFFNSTVAPQIGYQSSNELTDRNKRKKFGLKEKDLMPALEQNCTADCMDTYLSNNSDWVNVETIISTSPDQIAIAPGSLQREWTDNGRHYFQYKLDHYSLNFYSFISAHYEVARSEWNGINIEVYYLKEHPWNVPEDAELGEEVVHLLHAEFRALRAQAGADHRISSHRQFRSGISRNHAILRVHRIHCQP